jgi:hypothetical protein
MSTHCKACGFCGKPSTHKKMFDMSKVDSMWT